MHTHICIEISSGADEIHFSDFSLLLFLSPSLPAGSPNNILCLHRADVNRLLVVGQHWRLHELGSTEEYPLFLQRCPSCLFCRT